MSQSTTKQFVIKDPVHGYITVAAHERIVIDHPITQRLRRITQTGLAEFVFPEARTSRFAHSLGAMHLASKFFVSALSNADPAVLKKFMDGVEDMEELDGISDAEWEATFIQQGALNAMQSANLRFQQFSSRQRREFQKRIVILEAGLRLAALFHDLGHLPFSHDFEYALQDWFKEKNSTAGLSGDVRIRLQDLLAKDSPHEEIGHGLAKLVFKRLVSKNQPQTIKKVYALANRILDAQPEYDYPDSDPAGPLFWLHSLMDCEVDVDRADYLLRDGRALGLEFADYDLERLTINLKLICHPEMGFITAVDERGLTAIESFFVSRSRSNQVLARHHKVAQLACAFRLAAARAFSKDELRRFLADIGSISHPASVATSDVESLLDRFSTYDDGWFVTILRNLERSSRDALVKASLGLVLRREYSLRSIWKRRGDLLKHHHDFLNQLISFISKGSDSKIRVINLRRKLRNKGILIIFHKLKPYRVRDENSADDLSIMLIQAAAEAQHLSHVSPLVKSLKDYWEQDVHAHAFVLRNDVRNSEELLQEIISAGAGPAEKRESSQ